jgi:phosphatidate phosphatase APP1
VIDTAAFASPIKRDEEIVFFPVAARLSADLGHWIVPLHGWVFEPEADSLWRRGALGGLALSLGLEHGAADSEIFKQRGRWFLVDNERGKRVSVTLSSEAGALGPSGPDGHFQTEIALPRRVAVQETVGFSLAYSAVLPAGDDRTFQGEVLFPASYGLSVISDIDDTIKISQVTDKTALLANTFLKPFQAAPDMALAYDRLAAAGAVFHYVSSSPWQLYPDLRDFMVEAGFPRGSVHLRKFRVKDQSLFNLLKSSQETKPPVIEDLLRAYPKRGFILIGDSGEVDPEIYGTIARDHPGQIRHIFIRKVTSETAEDERYLGAFAGLPPSLWTLFDHAAAITP